MTRCAIYCRLSREDEDKCGESESIQNQRAILIDYAKAQDWTVCALYCDEDYSGADRHRPDFRRLLCDAAIGSFDVVLCKTQSRFTRDLELVERYLHGLFPLWGVRFVAPADHVDTALLGNKKARQINGLVSEWYLEDLSENVRMVLDHKRRQGDYIGGFPLYGYLMHPTQKGKLIVDPVSAPVVQQIFALACTGLGKQQIANKLNAEGTLPPARYKLAQGLGYRNGALRNDNSPWHRSTVGRILDNEMYLGHMIQGKRRKLSYKSAKLISQAPEAWFCVEGTHEALITEDQFFAVQQLHKARTKSCVGGTVHPLAGLVFCQACGRALHKNSYTRANLRRSYLRCVNADCPARAQDGKAIAVRLDVLLAQIDERLRHYAALWHQPKKEAASAQMAKRKTALQQAHAAETAQLRHTQYSRALQQLYLDKLSGIVSEEQFILLSASLRADIEAHTAQPPVLLGARADTETALPDHLPASLYRVFLQEVKLGGLDHTRGARHVWLRWRF